VQHGAANDGAADEAAAGYKVDQGIKENKNLDILGNLGIPSILDFLGSLDILFLFK
jgi:hypothetical protein